MNVSLTPELERLVEDKVKSGLYQTASEVVREGLRLLLERDEQLEALRREIDAGRESLERGAYREIAPGKGKDFADQLIARVASQSPSRRS